MNKEREGDRGVLPITRLIVVSIMERELKHLVIEITRNTMVEEGGKKREKRERETEEMQYSCLRCAIVYHRCCGVQWRWRLVVDPCRACRCGRRGALVVNHRCRRGASEIDHRPLLRPWGKRDALVYKGEVKSISMVEKEDCSKHMVHTVQLSSIWLPPLKKVIFCIFGSIEFNLRRH
jgi:hypothetical protein